VVVAERPALERLAQALLGSHREHMIGGEQEVRDATHHVHRAVNLAESEHYIVMSPRQVRATIEQSLAIQNASFLNNWGHAALARFSSIACLRSKSVLRSLHLTCR